MRSHFGGVGDYRECLAVHGLDAFDLIFTIRGPIPAQDVVEPDLWFVGRTWLVHGLPAEDCVGLTCYEAPIDRADVLPSEHREYVLESAVLSACHVLRADHWFTISLKRVYHRLMALRRLVGVIGDDVRVFNLPDVHLSEQRTPDSGSQWL